MQTIIVPLDGSELAERALPYAQMLATLFGAHIRLLRVINDPEGTLAPLHDVASSQSQPMSTEQAYDLRLWDLLQLNATNYLKAKLEALEHTDLSVDYEVRLGAPAEQIVQASEQVESAMVVMATHGYTGFKRWTLGSVADRVVHASQVPVLLVPGQGPAANKAPQLRRLLVPLDGSSLAMQALPLAQELAVHAQAQIMLFQAVSSVTNLYAGLDLPPDMLDALEGRATHVLRTTADKIREESDVAVLTVVELGLAPDQIVAQAQKYQVDLVVMATHGYSGIKRWALGSVTDKVLHAAPAPLLLIRAKSEAH